VFEKKKKVPFTTIGQVPPSRNKQARPSLRNKDSTII